MSGPMDAHHRLISADGDSAMSGDQREQHYIQLEKMLTHQSAIRPTVSPCVPTSHSHSRLIAKKGSMVECLATNQEVAGISPLLLVPVPS